MRPGESSMCFGAGVAAFMLGQDAVAQSRFECALALNPSSVSAAVWLADLHYRAGRLPEAISIYEAMRARSPQGRELQPQLNQWRKEQDLQSRFKRIRTEHFTALFEVATDEPLARDVIARLEVTNFADRQGARRLSVEADYGRALHTRAVRRHHQVGRLVGGGVRRTHPRAAQPARPQQPEELANKVIGRKLGMTETTVKSMSAKSCASSA